MSKIGTKILVIDDDASVLHALGMFLEQEGYDVVTAGGYDGRLARARRSDLPDLIILDILLSDENGCEVAKKLKSNDKTATIPIVMISAHPGGERMSAAAGADAYLAKPFEIEDLLESIERLGDQPQPAAA